MSIETIKARLDALEALEKAATPGPWEPSLMGPLSDVYYWWEFGRPAPDTPVGEVSTLAGSIGRVAEPRMAEQNKENVDLLCAARNALPGMIAALRTAEEALTFIVAETRTVGQEYGMPHVADRANSALAEIKRLLAGGAEAKR